MNGVHIDYFSIGNDGFAFSDQDSPNRIFMGDFKGSIRPWDLSTIGAEKSLCRWPLYVTQQVILDTW